MKEKILEKSLEQGYEESRLPEFTEEEENRIHGTSDFFGLNHYTTSLVQNADRPSLVPSYLNDRDIITRVNSTWDRLISFSFFLSFLNYNYLILTCVMQVGVDLRSALGFEKSVELDQRFLRQPQRDHY